MSATTVAIIIVSCFLHAGWNLLVRGRRAKGLFVRRMLVVSVVVGLVPAAAAELLARPLPGRAWLCVLGSGACCGAYYFALVRAYGSADFTVVYPVARSLPVLLVAVGDVVRGRWPTPLGWLGMAAVVAGCILAPLRSFDDIRARRYWSRPVLWMLLTALATVGYTMLDKFAAEIVSAGPATAARYGYWFFLFSWAGYVALERAAGAKQVPAGGTGWRGPALAAALNFGAYWLVLWAYQLDRHASYIVAMRQFSIVLGVGLALAIYRERRLAVRLAGTALVTAGVVLIALWGG